jgi:hypothetical protein
VAFSTGDGLRAHDQNAASDSEKRDGTGAPEFSLISFDSKDLNIYFNLEPTING